MVNSACVPPPKPNKELKPYWWAIVLFSLAFFVQGVIFLRYPGLQTDEVLFAAPFFRSQGGGFYLQIGPWKVLLMSLTYLGALKTWLYAPILWLAEPSVTVIRVPAVLIGSTTVAFFGVLLARIHGSRAAWVGCALLSTDAMFLLTTVFDWGPVALQHLLTVLAMLLAVNFFQNGRTRALAGSGLCCGLALWDKGLFVWIFSGMVAGALLWAGAIWRRLTIRKAAGFAGALCIGALPLIIYNLGAEVKFATIRSNSHFSTQEVAHKFAMLRATWKGDGLFGYLVFADTAPNPRDPETFVEEASFALRRIAGERRRNALEVALVLASFAGLLMPRTRKPILFCTIAVAIAWFQMAVTSGAGAAVHHIVLFWPLPHIVVAVAFAEASLRFKRAGLWALGAATAFLVFSNLLVMNQYFYQMARNGCPRSWSDAIFALSNGLNNTAASAIVLPDWGMTDSLDVLNRGRLPIRIVDDPFMPDGESAAQRQSDMELLEDGRSIWVEHTAGNEAFAGVNLRVAEAGRRNGFEQVPVAAYYDRNGRPVFQTFRFRRAE